MTWVSTRLKFLAGVPITNGLGESGDFDDPTWPRYIRTTDIAGPSSLRDDTFASLPPEVAGRAMLRIGDIVMTAAGATIGKSCRYTVDKPACYAGFLVRFRAKHGIDSRFISYWTESVGFWEQIQTGKVVSTIENFSASKYQNLHLDVPLTEQQRAIADYLDTETTRIDALTSKKQRMIELLEIRFIGESTANVLSGTRDKQTVQSRTGFYGLVPTGWKETSLRHLGCEVQTGPFGSQLHAEEYVENGWPVVNPQNLKNGRILPIANMSVSSEKRQDLCRHILRFGDIVFGRRGEMGRAGLVSEVEAGWLCGTGSLRLRLVSKEIVPEYFLLLLQTEAAKAYFQLSSVGSTMENLNSEILLDFPMLVPSVTEQSEIVLRMTELRTKKDQMNTILKEQVRLLSERRQALITAAVTGKFEIPEVAA